MVEYKVGNILRAEENIIVHQVNHQGVMGAGLALQIKNRFPIVYERYEKICNKLSWEQVQEAGGVDFCKLDDEFYVANLFGQRYFGKYHLAPDYKSIKNGFKTISSFAFRNEFSVAIPHGIGCGLGKGDWNIVSKIIEDVFTDEVSYCIYRLEE